MSVTLRIAGSEDADRVLRMIELARGEAGRPFDPDETRDALAPLLEDMPLGTVYLVGPPRSPVGYILLGFGYELAAGGIVATIEDIYVRAAVRGRGMGSEAISALMRGLEGHGVVELRLMPPAGTGTAKTVIERVCTRLRFESDAPSRLRRRL